MSGIRRGRIRVEVRIVDDPTGEPAILLQLPDGFVLLKRADEALGLGALLIDAAYELRREETHDGDQDVPDSGTCERYGG